MNRKLDIATLLLFTALLFGVIVRFYPGLTNGFPLNDGGMFYTMAQDLRANHFALPELTTYNQSGIPFAYPPFGFYIAALLSALTPESNLWVFLYVPALINSLSILAFYLFAKELTGSRPIAATVTLFFALTPLYFVWQVMGGGMTRAFGFLFMLLMMWQGLQLFRNYNLKHLLLSILFGAISVMSHPQAALQAVVIGVLLFLFYGRSKRGLLSAFLFGLGVAVLTSPWWLTVLTHHGITPFLSAGQTSPRQLDAYLELFSLNSLDDFLVLPLMLLAFVGLFSDGLPKLDKAFLVTWGVLAVLLDPRGAAGTVVLAFLPMAGYGLVKLSAWIQRMGSEQAEAVLSSRVSLSLTGLLVFFLLFGSIILDFQLVNSSLKAEDLDMIAWVEANVPNGKTFLLATGREYSMSDPMQEWFPSLTGDQSLTTMQGLEWTLNDGFFTWYEQVSLFQTCADVDCVQTWAERNNVNYDYLVVLTPTEGSQNNTADSLYKLKASAKDSNSFEMVYDSGYAAVFEKR
ncbi:MAG: glycosyltransferase family 39 protein [Anaerolineales bacterium]|nr:glycosyltransferase family 39 protein [Anaerolineales bacterium]